MLICLHILQGEYMKKNKLSREDIKLLKISQRDIANEIGRTDSSISYMKGNNPTMLNLLKLGVICKRLSLTPEKLLRLFRISEEEERKENELKKSE